MNEKILQFIKNYYQANGKYPIGSEIGKGLKINHKGIYWRIKVLVRLGKVKIVKSQEKIVKEYLCGKKIEQRIRVKEFSRVVLIDN